MSANLSLLVPGRVMTASRDVTISEAARLMKMMGIGSLVLTDDSNTPTGLVTDRDLVAKVGTGIDPRGTPVSECASGSLITADAGCEPAAVVALMKKHGVRRIPVLDADGKLSGIVTIDDVLLQLGAQTTGILADLAAAIRAGAKHEHHQPSAHERSL